MKLRFIDAGRVSALRSQTIYHALAYAKTAETPDTVIWSVPGQPYVCTGFHRAAAEEIDLEYCRSNQLPLIRRETGGGTVYIDDRQVFVQWIFGPERLPRMIEQRFRLFCRPLIETYQFFGINAFFFPPNDVHVRNRKIVGTGAGTIGDAEVVTGNFLLDFDPEPMANLLHVPDGPFRRLVREGMRNYMSCFQRELGEVPELETLKKVYREKCAETLEAVLEPGEFTEEELRWMDRLDEQFSSEEWLFGDDKRHSPLRRVKVHANVWVHETTLDMPGGGDLKITLRTKGKRIDDIALAGDHGLKPADALPGLENVLKHVELEPVQLQEILEAFFELHRVESTAWTIDDWVNALLTCNG